MHDGGEICRLPLVVAPSDHNDQDHNHGQSKYTLFEYVESPNHSSPVGSSTQVNSDLSESSASSSTAPQSTSTSPSDRHSTSPTTKYQLCTTVLDSLPESLRPYLASYKLPPGGSATSCTSSQFQQSKHPFLPPHLKNLVVINSTLSGTYKSSDVYFSVLKPLLDAFGIAHIYVSTTGPDTISKHASSFSSSTTVILLAGDTSAHEFVNNLSPMESSHRLTLCIIPTGSGNSLSHSIGHESIPHAISRIFLGQAQPLCVVPVSFPVGSIASRSNKPVTLLQSLMVVSWGFHASLVADSDSPEYRKFGPQRFGIAAKELLDANNEVYNGTIRLYLPSTESALASTPSLAPVSAPVSSQVTGPHSYVLFTTVNRLEKTFVISPRSNPPSSGDMFLIRLGPISSSEIMKVMTMAYDNGSHVSSDQVMYMKLTASTSSSATHNEPVEKLADIVVDDENPAHRRWCVDGEIVSVPLHSTVCIGGPRFDFNKWSLFVVV